MEFEFEFEVEFEFEFAEAGNDKVFVTDRASGEVRAVEERRRPSEKSRL